jgi:hypothetical protein
MSNTDIENLRKCAVDPSFPVHAEYFNQYPDRKAVFDEPKKLEDVLPQAVDPRHPMHNAFWEMVATGSIMLSETELMSLLDARLVVV